MRTLRKNRQQMKYAIPLYQEDKYKYDADGNKLIDYVDDDGTIFYVTTGEPETIYSEPVEFDGNIAGKIREVLAKEFGIDNEPNYATLVTAKGEYDFKYGTLIWRNHEPTYKEFNGNMIIDSASSDYGVVGTVDEFLNEDMYLLHKRQK